MARVFPFQPYRYSPAAGRLEDLVTQPYDKISPAMQARYLAASPHNLVRIILGERSPSDTAADNSYTRAARYLNEWIARGVLVKEREPALFAYFQEFSDPDSGEWLVRKGFIGLGAAEDYSAGVVHRHEQTLSGPKKDRLELLRQTRAHFGQIFVLYPDPQGAIDRLLEEAAAGQPAAEVADEYGARHTLWKIADPAGVAEIQRLMCDKKLLIADGHHRYETALAFRDEQPELEGAERVMMTFVNMHSPGLRILATHRLIHSLPAFDAQGFLTALRARNAVRGLGSLEELRRAWGEQLPGRARIGVLCSGGMQLVEIERGEGQIDVSVLHEALIGGVLGIDEEAVREERHVRYIRGLEAAAEQVRRGAALAALLLQPTRIEDVARVAFSGGVMPQKSTDFYPKLLSGLTIYRIEG